MIAAFDVGTTAAKGILIDRDRGIVHEGLRGYGTAHRPGGRVEQEPDDWWAAVRQLSQAFWRAGWEPGQVEAAALTGQMQDIIVVDREHRSLGTAILYADARAADQAAALRATLRAHGASDAETQFLDGTAPVAKLAWLREEDPERLDRCERILFNAKDYILARLAGVAATDATTAATTCLFEMQTRGWHTAWCDILGTPARLLPPILPADRVAGAVSDEGSHATGLVPGTPVYGGMGDAAAATLAAGLLAPGEAYLYLGTTGWAASLAGSVGPSDAGVRHLPYVTDDVIRVAPVLNAGNVHQWIARLLNPEQRAGRDGAEEVALYAGFERLLEGTPGRSDGAIFLPYLHGERCPVQDPRPLGTFVRLGAGTGSGALGWAVLEGICFSLRQVLETLGASAPTVRVLGGMARSPLVRQLIADVCGVRVHHPATPRAAGALAAAAPVAVARGWFAALPEAVEAWFGLDDANPPEAAPDPSQAAHYQDLYRIYTQIYPLITHLG